MKVKILDLIDFEKVDTLLEGFNKSTGFVTAILDLEGNVLSKSGWRTICTEFHRVHPETSNRCTISDTVLANKMEEGEKYHFYQCLNGLVDVAVPIVIKGEHIANLFSGQFFFEEPDPSFFKKQAKKYGFDKEKYMAVLKNVPVVSEEKVKTAMDFLLDMTQLISDMTFQKLEQMEMNEAIQKNERILRLFVEHSPASIAMFDNDMRYLVASHRFLSDYNLGNQNLIGRSHYEIFPEISERWKEFHRRGLAGETLKESNDPFPRADGKTDWVRWEIRPWYESENRIGGIILFSEVITEQVEAREALIESEKYNRMLFEQSAIGLALTSLDGRLVDVNTTFSTIIGRTVEEAKALTYWDITPEKYQNQEKQQLDLLAKTGRYGPYEKEYIHKDGHLVPVRLQGLIIERNYEKYIWSSVEDISEQKRAELDLIAAKEEIEVSERIKTDLLIKFNEAQQSAKIGNWDWDMVTNKVWWSDELYRIFDLDPNGFVPDVESNAKYAHPDDNVPYHTEVQRVIDNKEELNTDLRIISGKGTLKYCNSKAKLEFDENGNPVRFYGTFADITDRKLVQESLRESEKKYRYLFENNPLPMWIYDLQTLIFLEVNEAAILHYGYSKQEFLGMTLKDIRPDDEITRLLNDVDRTYSSYNKAGIWKHKKKNGSIIFVEIISHLIEYESTSARLVLAIDVTEKLKVEEALHESNEYLENLFNYANAPIIVWDNSFLITRFNHAFELLSGYISQEVIGEKIDILFPKDKIQSSVQLIEKTTSGERWETIEIEILRKDQVVKTVLWNSANIFDKTGEKIVATMAQGQDITDRKLAEQELKTLNSRLEILVHAVQELSSAQTLDQLLQIVTVSARKLIGSDGATIVFREKGNCFYANEDAISPLWKGKRFPLENCISGWVMLNNKHVIVPDIYADGRIPVEAYRPTFVKSLAMVPINTKGPIGAIGTYWKVNHKTSEMEISLLKTLADSAARSIENIQLYAELEERVQQRTAQLEAANKELETFTYSVSHDLKAPLRGIDGYSKLLSDLYANELNDEAKHFISTIRKSTQLMSQLIDDLLQYSRLERSQLRSEPVLIKPFVDAILRINEDEIISHLFSVTIDIPDTAIIADSNGIQMALRNLIENAIKFTKTVPDPAIEIKQEESERCWTISVKDNGIGFDMKYSQRIFEIFQRLHRVEDYPGTGIGLAMVGKAIQRMNGNARAESNPGQGATFYLEIPKPI